MHFNENFLGQIICVIVIDYHFPDMPIHSLLVRANKQIKTITPAIRVADFQ
jgi:hypothetical protein